LAPLILVGQLLLERLVAAWIGVEQWDTIQLPTVSILSPWPRPPRLLVISMSNPPTLARLVLLLAAVVLPAGCSYVTKPWITPGVTLVDFRPASITAEQQTFIVRLNVVNPNDRTLPIKGATYNVELDGYEIANGAGELDEQIPAFGEGVVDVAVNTDLLSLIRNVPASAIGDRRWSYRISGILELAGGYVPVPFRYSGEVETSQILSSLMR
jgi:LEA14-like dessication related protein